MRSLIVCVLGLLPAGGVYAGDDDAGGRRFCRVRSAIPFARAGRVQVEILDETGPIPGFSGKDAAEYQAVDDLRLKPAWKDNKDLSPLKGKVVRIRFRLRNAKLYAFQVQ